MGHRSKPWLRMLFMAVAIARAAILVADAQTQPASPRVPAIPERVARIAGHPNFNGVWQAMNTAYWNLEGHSAEPLDKFWQLGAIGAIPAGQSVVRGGTI